jgi:hypothetical protein
MAARRIVDMMGNFVICPDAQDLVAYFKFRVDLAPHSAQAAPQPSAAAITAPTPPFAI